MDDQTPAISDQVLESTPQTSPEVPIVKKPSSKRIIFIAIGIIIFLLLAGSAAGFYIFKHQTPERIACTMEAKVCPDGSSVGRSGPKCEFAKCPTSLESDETANWKTYANPILGIEFKMPKDYFITKENTNSIVLGHGKSEGNTNDDIMISMNLADFTNENSYQSCSKDVNGNIDNYPCRYIFQEKSPLILDAIDGKKVKYFYILNNSENGLGIYQTTETPFVEIKNYRSSGSDPFNRIVSTFKFTNSNQTPTPTCMQRPACLDATPRCMIAEPASGWCP